MEDRKPTPPAREPAQNKLNQFLRENDILIGTDRPDIDFTGKGQLIVSAPRIVAVYRDEVQTKEAETNSKVN